MSATETSRTEEQARERRGVAHTLLAALLLAMAAGQVLSFEGFVDAIVTYQLGGGRVVAAVAAVALIGAEALAAIGLLSRTHACVRRASSVGVVVAMAWSALAAQAFARGLAVDNCGCFGAYLPQRLRWWVLLEDAEFVALAWWVRRRLRVGG